jgi:hypothetical protein
MANLIVFASEAEAHGGGVNPYVVGGGALAGLLILLLIVVAIGGGREHS